MRRRFQYSLRTILLVTLVSSLLAGFWVWHIKPYLHEARVARYIERLGGSVKLTPDGPAWLRGIAGDKPFRRIVQASLGSPKVREVEFSDLPRLEWLSLGAPMAKIRLARLPAVKTLSVEAEGLALNGLPRLRELHLRGKLIQVELRELPNLEIVYCYGPLTDKHLAVFASLPRLKWLELSRTRITNDGLAVLGRLPCLEELRLTSTAVTDAGMRRLELARNLKVLHLYRTEITDAGVKKLQQVLPKCRIYRSTPWTPPARPEVPVGARGT